MGRVMDQYFALIKKNIVQHVIVADEFFLHHIEKDYDYIINVTDTLRPQPGDSYYPETKIFVSNTISAPEILTDLTAEHLQSGIESGFEPFNISKYSVKYENGIVTIGCKQYPAAGLRDSLHKLIIHRQQNVACFTILEKGPAHGKFDITWEDAQMLYDALLKVKIK